MRLGLNLLALLVLLCATVAAQAAGKVALVIGNGAYLNANVLPNPTNDAADVTVKLKNWASKCSAAMISPLSTWAQRSVNLKMLPAMPM